MSNQEQNKEPKINYQINNIEILDVDISFPGQRFQEKYMFHYQINVQHRVNAENKLLFVYTSILTMAEDKTTRLGHIKAACVFFIENLMDFESNNKEIQFDLPETFISILNTISISTTRGIMFAQFKGTFLHNAILPLIDPKSLTLTQENM